jgi:hypothetical protein
MLRAGLLTGLLAACSSGGPGAASHAPSPVPHRTSGESGGGTGAAGVSIATDRTAYAQGQPITATIRNDGSQDAFAASGRSFCSILTVERSSADGWRQIAPCAQGAPPGFVRIAAGASLTIDLPPPDSSSEELAPGDYRLRCSFAVGGTDGPSGEARSPVFTVEA